MRVAPREKRRMRAGAVQSYSRKLCPCKTLHWPRRFPRAPRRIFSGAQGSTETEAAVTSRVASDRSSSGHNTIGGRNMIRQTARRGTRLLTLSIGTLMSLAEAMPSKAQEAPGNPSDEELAAVVITGSRVVREGYGAPTPTTVVGAEQIGMAAPANVADYLNTLPALPGSSTTRQGNNSISAATAGMNRLDLRGIGP